MLVAVGWGKMGLKKQRNIGWFKGIDWDNTWTHFTKIRKKKTRES